MLVLTRKVNEEIVIDGGIRITVVQVRGNKIRLGISAPDHVAIRRAELEFPADDCDVIELVPGASEFHAAEDCELACQW